MKRELSSPALTRESLKAFCSPYFATPRKTYIEKFRRCEIVRILDPKCGNAGKSCFRTQFFLDAKQAIVFGCAFASAGSSSLYLAAVQGNR